MSMIIDNGSSECSMCISTSNSLLEFFITFSINFTSTTCLVINSWLFSSSHLLHEHLFHCCLIKCWILFNFFNLFLWFVNCIWVNTTISIWCIVTWAYCIMVSIECVSLSLLCKSSLFIPFSSFKIKKVLTFWFLKSFSINCSFLLVSVVLLYMVFMVMLMTYFCLLLSQFCFSLSNLLSNSQVVLFSIKFTSSFFLHQSCRWTETTCLFLHNWLETFIIVIWVIIREVISFIENGCKSFIIMIQMVVCMMNLNFWLFLSKLNVSSLH